MSEPPIAAPLWGYCRDGNVDATPFFVTVEVPTRDELRRPATRLALSMLPPVAPPTQTSREQASWWAVSAPVGDRLSAGSGAARCARGTGGPRRDALPGLRPGGGSALPNGEAK